MEKQKEWFEDWFDSPYYHILYGHRDMQEAEFFLRNFVHQFNPPAQSTMIDLACGKGRHSIFMNSLGFDVTGVDLSKHSISLAKEFENESLKFEVSDLRSLSVEGPFDYALNLFTSFAYFDNFETDEQVLLEIKKVLKPKGMLLIDFFNAQKVLETLVLAEEKENEGVLFKLNRRFEDGKIVKSIEVNHNQENYYFEEKVQALRLQDFETLLAQTGFELLHTYGAYDFSPFDLNSSDRLILIAQNIHVK